jgi:Phage Terminase
MTLARWWRPCPPMAVPDYADQVRDAARRRRLMDAALTTLVAAAEGSDVDDAISATISTAESLIDGGRSKTRAEVLRAAVAAMEKPAPVYPTGLPALDRVMGGGLDLDELLHAPCWLGVDLSSNSDLTVVVACWRVGDGYAVLPHFFCPKDNLRLRQDRDGVPYVRWAEEGLIEPTPGNVVDFRVVEDCIRDLCDRFDVQAIGLDPHLARNTLNNLTEDGLPAVEVRQGWVTLAPAIKDLERAIIGRQFQHGGHPVLRWCFDNIQVETDRAGNRLFSKGKARERIDGAAACATAVSLAMHGDGGPSIYETDQRPDGFLWI